MNLGCIHKAPFCLSGLLMQSWVNIAGDRNVAERTAHQGGTGERAPRGQPEESPGPARMHRILQGVCLCVSFIDIHMHVEIQYK
jgi:hypothetical protein